MEVWYHMAGEDVCFRTSLDLENAKKVFARLSKRSETYIMYNGVRYNTIEELEKYVEGVKIEYRPEPNYTTALGREVYESPDRELSVTTEHNTESSTEFDNQFDKQS